MDGRVMGIAAGLAFAAWAPTASGGVLFSNNKLTDVRLGDSWGWAGPVAFESAGGGTTQKSAFGSKLVVPTGGGENDKPKPPTGSTSAERGLRRIPLTQQELVAFRGNIGELDSEGRPITAPPGVFVNYIPNPGDIVDDNTGNGTSVPVPPAFVLGATGLGMAALIRRFMGKPMV